MDKSSALSTREWLLIIIIIVGAQFIVHSISYLYSGSANALGYVSFAGTIVSILLGLIAIIYSFVQSISHGSSVRDVKDQALLIVEAGKGIVVSKEVLSESAFKISEAANELIDRINENTDATNKVAGVVGKINESFGEGVGKVNESSVNISPNSVLSSNRIWIVVLTICLGEAVKERWSSNVADKKIIEPLCQKLGMDEKMGSSVYLTIAMCLEAEGFIVFSGDNAVESVPLSNNGFSEKVKAITEMYRDAEEKEYVVLYELLDARGGS